MIIERTHKTENESLSGWVAKAGKDLVKEFGEAKAKSLMDRRFNDGLYYNSEDFPDDQLERFYYMRKPKEINKRQSVSDSTSLRGDADLNNDMLKALTDETTGMMRQGALPEGHAASSAGQKALRAALSESVAAAPKKKKEKEKDAGSEVAKPKTIVQLAQDLMADVLAESVAARKKSMSLGSVNYAGELSSQLLQHAERLEKDYKSLQRATKEGSMTETSYQACLAQIQKRRLWYTTAEAGRVFLSFIFLLSPSRLVENSRTYQIRSNHLVKRSTRSKQRTFDEKSSALGKVIFYGARTCL